MLTHIVNPKYFKACIEAVKRAYYPYEHCYDIESYLTPERFACSDSKAIRKKIDKSLFNLEKGYVDSQQIKKVREAINTSVDKEVVDNDYYLIVDQYGNFVDGLTFPLISNFHKWFLLREWDEPYQNPSQQVDNLLRLKDPKNNTSRDNYSRQAGNFNHFVNVVAALSRLIWYFTKPQKVKSILPNISNEKDPELFYETVYYNQTIETLRIFRLMLAAFYHDIGKTIIDSRHAMEGAIILASHTTQGRYQLNKIFQESININKDNSQSIFEWDDLLIVSDLILYHDQYGTLSTGEDSYLQLAEIIDKFYRYSLVDKNQELNKKPKEICQKFLFDLWLLNVADILVSLENKFTLQDDWWEEEYKANDKLDDFFKNNDMRKKSSCLIHDFEVSLDLLNSYLSKSQILCLVDNQGEAHSISVHHSIERLRRLIAESLNKGLKNFKKKLKKEPDDRIKSILDGIQEISEKKWNLMIVQAIESIADRNEYCNRFSWISKSDYALGFFSKLAEAALLEVAKEIQAEGHTGQRSTGWIYRDSNGRKTDKKYKDYLGSKNALLFSSNYTMIVVQIIEHLIFREPCLDRPRNLEFSDATKRLQGEKVNTILGLEGPFRARYSTYLILQSIYLY